MKKLSVLICVMLIVTALLPVASIAKTNRAPGGVPAFFIGCCWGLREGVEWNDGADLHWREWCRIIPYAGIVFAIWDGVDCYNGIGAKAWADANGANWY